MNDQDKKRDHYDAPKIIVGQRVTEPSGLRKLLVRKWITPVATLVAVVGVLTVMWVYRDVEKVEPTAMVDDVEVTQGVEDVPTTTEPQSTEEETMQWPVVDRANVDVTGAFYDENAPEEERQAALIQTGNTFLTRRGIDLATSDNKPFDVTAALSGQVLVVEKHPLNGNVVEIKHSNGMVTVYQSLSDVQVEAGDEVAQGAIIAKAGRNELEKELGNHLYFGVLQDGQAVNPSAVLNPKEQTTE
jgi:stage II sporulation protein Q